MVLGLTQPFNRNEYQGGKGDWCIGLTTLPPLCANFPEIWEPQPPGTLWACNRPVKGLLYVLAPIIL
jgi:hypothetical protein